MKGTQVAQSWLTSAAVTQPDLILVHRAKLPRHSAATFVVLGLYFRYMPAGMFGVVLQVHACWYVWGCTSGNLSLVQPSF